MSNTPPGVKRVVAVLNFFAEHPGQSFTFTDIVKALDLGRATCHSMLAGLVEAQYLYRNRDKTYIVGPALAAVGKIAHEQFSPMQAAQPEMRALSDEYRAICAAVYHERGNAVIRSRTGSGSGLIWSMPEGYELPLRAPFASGFFMAAEPREIDQWLEQLTPPVTAGERKEFLAGIDFTRGHGYTFGVYNPKAAETVESPREAFTGKIAEYPATVATTLDRKATYQLAYVNCPVFNQREQVEFVLNLSGFSGPIPGARVEEMGRKLRDAAERITYFLNGRSKPYPFPD